MVEATEVQVPQKVAGSEQPRSNFRLGTISLEEADIYRRIIRRLKEDPEATGASLQIIQEGEDYPIEGGRVVPEGKLGVFFRETEPGLLNAQFFGAFNRALQIETELERKRLMELEEPKNARKAPPKRPSSVF